MRFILIRKLSLEWLTIRLRNTLVCCFGNETTFQNNFYKITSVSPVQSLSCIWLFATPWTAAHQASLSVTNLQSLLKLMSIELVMPSNHLILCHPLLLLPSIFPSIRVFSNESVLCIRWPKALASASVLPMNIQDWSPLGWTGWISLLSKGLSRVFSNTTVQKHQFFSSQPSLWSSSTSIHDYWKNHLFDYMDLCWQSNVSTNSRQLNTEKFNPVFNVKGGGTVLSSCKYGLKNHRQNWCCKEIKNLISHSPWFLCN